MWDQQKLDKETSRQKWQNPKIILKQIGLGSGKVFVDIGCGYGFFAIPAAQIVGQEGRVHAIDLDTTAINTLTKEAAKEGIKNIITRTGPAEGAILCEGCADIAFFGIVLHDFKNPKKVLINAKKMLKPTGKLVNLDWKKEQTPFGPPINIRFTKEKAADLIKKAGFKIGAINAAGPYNYIITAKPRRGYPFTKKPNNETLHPPAQD